MSDSPLITMRSFWTWDHCTTWTPNIRGGHDFGAGNEYGRTSKAFVSDYALLLDWCGRHAVDAVVIWGLLRDGHGGLDSAKRLCELARAAGAKVLAGVGLCSYGGVYYEGDSPYCLERHLEAHPELSARDEAGEPLASHRNAYACPSRPENQEFTQESLRWLFETLDLGGAQIETGDTGVCLCRLCRERRQYPASNISWDDMVLMYPLAVDAVRSVRADAQLLLETYTVPESVSDGGVGDLPPWGPACLAQFPRNVTLQWVGDEFIVGGRSLWSGQARPPRPDLRHLMRAHFGTHWCYYGRDALGLVELAALTKASLDHGFDGFSIFGESSPFNANAELHYLAFADFGSPANPECDLESFVDRVAGPLLGGPERARLYLELAVLKNDPAAAASGADRALRAAAGLEGRPAQRWAWLANHLASYAAPTFSRLAEKGSR